MSEGNHVDTNTTNLIGAALLAEIENLQLRAQLAAQGALAGMHRSIRRGTSIEFSEHKLYSPGDDIRHIDWRAYAKTDRYHIKQFEDETNLTLEILLDHSGSMRFASDSYSQKIDYSRTIAGALSYLALRQGDAAGLFAFADKVSVELLPRAASTHLLEILSHLVRLKAEGPTQVGACLNRFAQSRRRRRVIFIISDLFDADPSLFTALRHLAARRHDITLLHIMDPAEINFHFENPSIFASLEDERRLFVHPRTLRNAYLNEMKKFLNKTEQLCNEARIDYHHIITSTPPEQTLTQILHKREARVSLRRNVSTPVIVREQT
ncbi:MAG: DUF58 domain-containing protein [Deltaproteobacteria bacterium]|nr:DUF58 domain-containing protein [Deltaproteobacteria bacterium]